MESFENSDGGWTTGGERSDWAWGTPSKTQISNIAEGSKCWITGGLSKSYYNSNQLSWLRTPCFDFTDLEYPFISFDIFFDSEQGIDGAMFEYSTDNGLTWLTAGSVNYQTDCLHQNWFNAPSVASLNKKKWLEW